MYASSPDRGLQQALKILRIVRHLYLNLKPLSILESLELYENRKIKAQKIIKNKLPVDDLVDLISDYY